MMTVKEFEEQLSRDIDSGIVTDENISRVEKLTYEKLALEMFESWKETYEEGLEKYKEKISLYEELGKGTDLHKLEGYDELLKLMHQITMRNRIVDKLIVEQREKVNAINKEVEEFTTVLVARAATTILKHMREEFNENINKLGPDGMMAAQYIAEFKEEYARNDTSGYIDSVSPILTQFVHFFFEKQNIYEDESEDK